MLRIAAQHLPDAGYNTSGVEDAPGVRTEELSMCQEPSLSSAQLHPGRLPARLLAKCLLVFVSAFLVATPLSSATDPIGATLHNNGTTTFRVWAPFVDNVAVKINGGAVVLLTKEPGHT